MRSMNQVADERVCNPRDARSQLVPGTRSHECKQQRGDEHLQYFEGPLNPSGDESKRSAIQRANSLMAWTEVSWSAPTIPNGLEDRPYVATGGGLLRSHLDWLATQ